MSDSEAACIADRREESGSRDGGGHSFNRSASADDECGFL